MPFAPTPVQAKLVPSTNTYPRACRFNGSGLRAIARIVPGWTYSSVGASHGLLSSQTMHPRCRIRGEERYD
jgi:hypothetical protein